MYANDLKAHLRNNLVTIVGALFFLALASVAHSQTLSEISDLQKAKVIADLKKQIASANDATPQPASAGAIQASSQALRKVESEQSPAPSVLAVYGTGDELAAAISESGGKAIRVKAGDRTPEGWVVERITRSGVSFVRTTSTDAQHKRKAEKQMQVKELRVHVAWSQPSSPSPGTGAIPYAVPVLSVQPGQVPAQPPLPAARQVGQ